MCGHFDQLSTCFSKYHMSGPLKSYHLGWPPPPFPFSFLSSFPFQSRSRDGAYLRWEGRGAAAAGAWGGRCCGIACQLREAIGGGFGTGRRAATAPRGARLPPAMGANNNGPGGARLLAAADAGDLGAELAPSVEARNGGPIGASSLMVAHDSGLGGARPRSGGPNRARPLPEAAVGDLRAELAQPMEVHSGGDLEHGGGYYGMVDGLECGGGLRCDDGLERSGICDPDNVEMLTKVSG